MVEMEAASEAADPVEGEAEEEEEEENHEEEQEDCRPASVCHRDLPCRPTAGH